MSHVQQMKLIELMASGLPQYFKSQRVLEIGSLDINGSIRRHFESCDYIGIDVAPGKGVDVVCQGQDFAEPDGSFDHVVSCEVMEHNPHWRSTFANMVRLCRAGGLVVMTCATIGRPEHGTTRTNPSKSPLTVELKWEYYKNLTEENFRSAVDLNAHFSDYYFAVNWSSFDLYFCGIKRSSTESISRDAWPNLTQRLDSYVFSENQRKICRYRRLAAKHLGDSWFTIWRKIGDMLNSRLIKYAHQ